MLVYICIVSQEEDASVPLPDGLVLVEDFVSPEEEALLLSAVDWSATNDGVTGEGVHILSTFLFYTGLRQQEFSKISFCNLVAPPT